MQIIKSKIYLLCAFPIGINLIFGCLYASIFEILSAVSALLFLIIQYSLHSFLHVDINSQKGQYRPVSFFLLLPPIVTITGGILLLFSPDLNIGYQSYLTVFTSAVLLVCLILQFISIRKNTSLAGRLLRLTIAAAMSVPLSLGITLLLHLTNTEEATVLSCMTTTIFGGLSFLLIANIIMISYCGYKSTIVSIQTISTIFRKRKLVFTRVSILKDAFLVVGKGLISILSISFFMFVNALFSAGMGIARFIAVRMHTQEKSKQIMSYRYVGIIISIASICYVLYSVRLFFDNSTSEYDMYLALVIALYTFVEFGINIKEAIKLRKSKALEAKAIRAISFSATLICFVLTQTAIMSFASEGDSSFVNAISGVVFGGLAALVGIYVVLESISNKRKLEIK